MALLSVGATVLLWGMHGPVVNTLVRDLPWPQVVAINISWAVLFLIVFCAVTGRLGTLRRYSLGQYGRLALLGGLGVFAYYGLLFYSFTTVEHAMPLQVLNYLFPVITVLLSAALIRGERLTLRRVVSVLVAFFGAYWVLTRGRLGDFRPESWRGVAAATGAAVAYGLFGTLSRRYAYEPISGMLIFFIAGGVLSLGLLPLMPLLNLTPRMPTIEEWGRLAFVGIASNCLGTFFWLRALRAGDTALVGSLVYLAVFVSVLGFRVLCREPVSSTVLIGVATVVVGGILASRPQRKRRPGPGTSPAATSV